MKTIFIILIILAILNIIYTLYKNYNRSLSNVYVKVIEPTGMYNLHFEHFPYKHGDLIKLSGKDYFHEVHFPFKHKIYGIAPTLYKYEHNAREDK